MWVKYWKKSGPNQSLDEKYIHYKNEIHTSVIKYDVELWAERIPGGHNTSYSYGWEDIEVPPKEWLEKHIKYIKEDIEEIKQKLKDYELDLQFHYGTSKQK